VDDRRFHPETLWGRTTNGNGDSRVGIGIVDVQAGDDERRRSPSAKRHPHLVPRLFLTWSCGAGLRLRAQTVPDRSHQQGVYPATGRKRLQIAP